MKLILSIIFLISSSISYAQEEQSSREVPVKAYFKPEISFQAGYVHTPNMRILSDTEPSQKMKRGDGGYFGIGFNSLVLDFGKLSFSPAKISFAYHYLNNTYNIYGGYGLPNSEHRLTQDHFISLTVDPTVTVLKGFAGTGTGIDVYAKFGLGILNFNQAYRSNAAQYFNETNSVVASVAYGAGVIFNFTENLGLNFEYIGVPGGRIKVVGDTEHFSYSNINMIKAGVNVKFSI